MKPNLFAALTLVAFLASAKAEDSLPSWNEGAAKKAIVDFVAKVTKEGSPDFVPVTERIATFDNDGTLLAEQPTFIQGLFALDRVKALAPQHPEWKDQEPFASVLKGDMKRVAAGGDEAIQKIAIATHTGMTAAEFEQTVKSWLGTAKHPKFNRPYTQCVYQPMLELLDYLRANGFKTFIVSGGGVEFMRPWTEKVYGIPPEQVLGSRFKTKFEMRDGKSVLVQLPEIDVICLKSGKPVSINAHIGRRPIAAFGNSEGDREMLEWTQAGSAARLMMLVLHDDADREFADAPASDAFVAEAKKNGWSLISMKHDWKRVFPADPIIDDVKAQLPVQVPSFLDRAQPGTFDLRVMTWNVWLSSIFPPDGVRRESFVRIVKAIKPDVLCLQEIDPRGPARKLVGMMDQILPLKEGLHWQAHYATNMDLVVLSRYPLLRRAQEAVTPLVPGYYLGQIMCQVDLPESLNVPDVYVIATHFNSNSEDERSIRARQRHADSIVRWLRGQCQRGQPDSLPARTPMVILGDLNVYEGEPKDATHHLTTLLTGNIVDEAAFGPDIKPDWDGTYLIDVKPRHNGREKDWYTWRVDRDRFAPGALDRIIYTDSVMKVRNSFVLNTTTMREEELSRSGLLATDVLKGGKPGEFDHMPLVADFIFAAQ